MPPAHFGSAAVRAMVLIRLQSGCVIYFPSSMGRSLTVCLSRGDVTRDIRARFRRLRAGWRRGSGRVPAHWPATWKQVASKVLSSATVTAIVRVMSSMYRAAVKDGVVVSNPFTELSLPPVEPQPVFFYEPEEAVAL
jgi:hypothetical protein